MPDFISTAYTFSEVLVQIENNERFCTKIILQYNQLDHVNSAAKIRFCVALEQNNTLTYLGLGKVDDEFFLMMLRALQNNKTLTSVRYDEEGINSNSILEMQKILERNRALALEKTIIPRKININPDLSDETRRECVLDAAKTGDLDLLYTLIVENPKLLRASDRHHLDHSPLHVASKHAQIDCVKLLLQLGAEIDYNPRHVIRGHEVGTALHEAVDSEAIVVVQQLLNSGASVHSRKNGTTPLHKVCSLEIAQILVDHHADVNAVCSEDTACKHFPGVAVLSNVVQNSTNFDLISFLIKSGAKINTRSHCGDTPLHFVNYNYMNQKVINMLIRGGASPLLKNDRGRLPAGKGYVLEPTVKEYSSVRKTALMMAQGRRSKHSIFSWIPDDVCCEIAQFMGGSYLDEKTIHAVVIQNFRRP